MKRLHGNVRAQRWIALGTGVLFGFLLQKGGVTRFDVIVGQLLLGDFTVVRIMLTAVLTGMILVHILRELKLAELHPKPGSFGSSALGGLVFGVGFGILGYCPGTAMGAVGQGSLDALVGAVPGMLLGAGLFAAAYPRMEKTVLRIGDFGDATVPRLLKANAWAVVIPVAAGILLLLVWLRNAGIDV